jgi:hypothetical protein
MEISIHIETEKFNRGFIDLQKASSMAARNTLNIIAAITRKNFVKNVQDNFTLRNTFTVRNIRYEKTETLHIPSMVTRTGATERAGYLKTHELPERRISKRGSHLAIPQISARGGSWRRTVSRQHYLRMIKNRSIKGKFRKNFKSRKAQNVARAYIGFHKKLYYKYSDNIYLIVSFRKIGNKIRFSKRHIYNVSEKTVHIRQTKSLEPAYKQPVQNAQNIYNSQMNKLLRQENII